jgi:hypothetical protein
MGEMMFGATLTAQIFTGLRLGLPNSKSHAKHAAEFSYFHMCNLIS